MIGAWIAANFIVKSCPFCDENIVLDKTLRDGYKDFKDDQDAYTYNIRCKSCAATGGWSKNSNGAIRMWNMRSKTTRTLRKPE